MLCKKCRSEVNDSYKFCPFCGSSLTTTRKANPKSRANGTGSVYKLPNGKYKAEVTIAYYEQDGKLHRRKRTKTFVKKKDAIAYLPILKVQQEVQKRITLFELQKIYTGTKAYDKLSKSQKDKLGYAWKRLEPLYDYNIATLTIDDMQRTIDEAVKTYYPARDMKVMLSHLYDIAIKREYVQYNKTEYIELPELSKSKRDAFTSDEINTLWEAYDSGNTFVAYILIMIYAGLRFGELATIKKENVHLDEHYAIGGIKTEAGIDREIAFADKIMPVVTELYNSSTDRLLSIGENSFYDKYHECINSLGIRDLPPHCCRHTYFTRLAVEGVQPAVITESGGHKDLSTTMQYIHIPLEAKLAAVNKI